MNLTIAEIARLPLAAALFDGDDIVAATPEWQGAAPGSVVYTVRQTRLVVSTESAHPMCGQLVGMLLDEIDTAAHSLARPQRLRAAMLAASLRVLAGRRVSSSGNSSDVVESACAGITSRTALEVCVRDVDEFAVLDPSVAALVLVQFAANAERHDRADLVTLSATDHCFAVRWHASPGSGGAVTARRRAERARWGMGFARIAADSIGAAVYPPKDEEAGCRVAVLEVGLNRLALPLAAIADASVRKATRAWDEETNMPPGTALTGHGHAAACVLAAERDPGALVVVEGWSARHVDDMAWIAIPPDSVTDRARDVLDGMVHERALWDDVREPARTTIVALAALLDSLLGGELPRVPAEAWNRRAASAARDLGVALPIPRFDGIGAIDPRVVLYLAARYGAALEAEGDDLFLRIAESHRDDPLVRVFLAPGDDCLKLS